MRVGLSRPRRRSLCCIEHRQETEAWYLGDPKAVYRTFSKVKRTRLNQWHPDSVGQTWELFQEIINAPTDDKVAWGEAMGQALTVTEPLENHNRSPSFRKFCRRVRELAGEPPHKPKSRRSRKPARASRG